MRFNDRANEIYLKVEDKKNLVRGRNQDVILVACLFIACWQEDKPHTVKGIWSSKQKHSETTRASEGSITCLGFDGESRLCSPLGMNNRAVKAAQEAVLKSEGFDIRRTPVSIAAVVIYAITQLSDDKKPLTAHPALINKMV
ncbi:hypothetical protein RHMOL_Rhmol13G0128700 [Rhododendron molle]|uniref:Uncharacterized protein n=1 Tax=Rhododendron molle TaxID=49168 RepID=A0ACC0L7E9_RHOML|nr:hypothetical protein RHMOL_Rhmol13G0128700 [Rhododendron molle]